MAETRTLTCITCPRGCAVTVTLDESGAVASVAGNACRRGDAYARAEVAHPLRTVTTTVPVDGSARARRISVKTAAPVPKGSVAAVVAALADVRAAAPVEIGDVILPDAADTGVAVVATSRA